MGYPRLEREAERWQSELTTVWMRRLLHTVQHTHRKIPRTTGLLARAEILI